MGLGEVVAIHCRLGLMVGDTALVLGSLKAMISFKNMRVQEFPGGPVVKNPPDKAADTGLIPDLGRFHRLRVSKAHAPLVLNPCTLESGLHKREARVL